MNALRKILLVIGSLVAVAGAGLGGFATWRSGLLERITPDAPVKVVSPVSVRLYGPTMAVRGDTVYFHAAVTGPAGAPVWRIVPPTNGALLVLPDSMTAAFRSLDEGTFSITVSVAGEAMQVASDHVEFENLNFVENVQPAQQALPIAAMQTIEAPPIPTVAELTQHALEEVQSDDRAAEARVLAGCIRSVSSRIETGLMPPDADPLVEIRRHAEAALGPKIEAWRHFLDGIGLISASLRDQGEITTAATWLPTLHEVTDVLLHAQ